MARSEVFCGAKRVAKLKTLPWLCRWGKLCCGQSRTPVPTNDANSILSNLGLGVLFYTTCVDDIHSKTNDDIPPVADEMPTTSDDIPPATDDIPPTADCWGREGV